MNGAIGQIFTNWVQKAYPDRADKILNQIKSCHNGSLNDSRFGARSRGEGKIAEQISTQFKLARKIYMKESKLPPLDFSLFDKYETNQTSLF